MFSFPKLKNFLRKAVKIMRMRPKYEKRNYLYREMHRLAANKTDHMPIPRPYHAWTAKQWLKCHNQ